MNMSGSSPSELGLTRAGMSSRSHNSSVGSKMTMARSGGAPSTASAASLVGTSWVKIQSGWPTRSSVSWLGGSKKAWGRDEGCSGIVCTFPVQSPPKSFSLRLVLVSAVNVCPVAGSPMTRNACSSPSLCKTEYPPSAIAAITAKTVTTVAAARALRFRRARWVTSAQDRMPYGSSTKPASRASSESRWCSPFMIVPPALRAEFRGRDRDGV